MNSTRENMQTPMDAMVTSLRACGQCTNDMAKPAAILWTDPKEEWKELLGDLLKRLPELILLGDYSPVNRMGPAIWIRCIVERTLDNAGMPEDLIPIVYIPGVAKRELRAGEDCPLFLRPLVELMYRGTMWLQYNGKDWTTLAFLTTSREQLQLDIAEDKSTLEALRRALREVFITPLPRLRDKRMEAEDFDKMLSDDPVRELLRWLSGSDKEQMNPEAWDAFRNQTKSQFQFDPDMDDRMMVCEKLGEAEGAWKDAWVRFAEAPTAWPGVAELLRESRPVYKIIENRSHWPDLNDNEEDAVRESLQEICKLPQHEACQKVLELEQKHGERRSWAWIQLGFSPMAAALEHLAVLAEAASTAVGGLIPDEIADAYEQNLWRADAASWQAVLAVPATEQKTIYGAIRAIMEDWLDSSARAFQRTLDSHHLPSAGQQEQSTLSSGTFVLFADGLRYDLARTLSERLIRRGYSVETKRRWAALPTVTATAKPAATPVCGCFMGKELTEDFTPVLTDNEKPADTQAVRHVLSDNGYQVSEGEPAEEPNSSDKLGWAETGTLDKMGHSLGDKFPNQIEQELELLIARIDKLFESGWTAVRVITDHGWLWLPGGLPKVDLPKHLTLTKWGRCAVINPAAQIESLTAPWHWNTSQRFATPPGISCYYSSHAYSHGGLSIQECLLCDIYVERGGMQVIKATVNKVSWRRLRCTVEVLSNGGGTVYTDLRLDSTGGKSIISERKLVDNDGVASFLVDDDDYEGREVVLVLLDESGTVLAHTGTTVGGNNHG